MYYFGTNLESRFSVPGFWPPPEQTHKIPFERDELRDELDRLKRMRLEKRARRLEIEAREAQMENEGR
jgi:protein PET100